MRPLINHSFGLLAASLVLGGCSSPRTVPVASAKPKEARLSAAEAIGIAKEAAVKHGSDLSRYEEPKAHFDFTDDMGLWLVLFDGKVARPGNHLMVVVDDQTGKARVVPGR
jgi:hypothetical protein